VDGDVDGFGTVIFGRYLHADLSGIVLIGRVQRQHDLAVVVGAGVAVAGGSFGTGQRQAAECVLDHKDVLRADGSDSEVAQRVAAPTDGNDSFMGRESPLL